MRPSTYRQPNTVVLVEQPQKNRSPRYDTPIKDQIIKALKAKSGLTRQEIKSKIDKRVSMTVLSSTIRKMLMASELRVEGESGQYKYFSQKA